MSTPIEARESRHRHLPDVMGENVKSAVAFDWPLPRASWSDEVIQSYDAFQRDVAARAAREVDVATVFRYFDVLAMQGRLFELLINQELMEEDRWGNSKINPALSAFSQMIVTGLRIAKEIGATPMSRIKLGLYAVEGHSATMALEREINKLSDDDVKVDLKDGEIVLSW